MRLDPGAAELFGGGYYVHLATLRPDGAPQADRSGRSCTTATSSSSRMPSSLRARDIEHDPRVVRSVVDFTNPYRNAWVRGRVVRTIEGEDALTIIDRSSDAYTGAPFPMRSGVVFVVSAEASGFGELPFRHDPA